MSTYAKYSDIHKNRKKGTILDKDFDHNKLMTDRNAYLSYLEVQLEKVTSACLTVQGFSSRIAQIEGELGIKEERIVNLTRIIKLLQNYSEEQEEETKNLKNQVQQLQSQDRGQISITNQAQNMEATIEMQSRVEKLEEKMSALKGSTDNQQFRTSVVFDQFSNEVDRKVREAEIRIKNEFKKSMEENDLKEKSFQKSIEMVVEKQGTEIANEITHLENHINIIKDSSNLQSKRSISPTHPSARVQFSDTQANKVEEALNQWTDKIEAQLNLLQADSKEKDHFYQNEFKRLEIVIQNEKERHDFSGNKAVEIAKHSENICNRFSDDVLKRTLTIEQKISSLQADVDEFLTLTDSARRKYISGLTTRGEVELKELERRFTTKLSNAITEIGDVVKSYMMSNKRLEERMNSMIERKELKRTHTPKRDKSVDERKTLKHQKVAVTAAQKKSTTKRDRSLREGRSHKEKIDQSSSFDILDTSKDEILSPFKRAREKALRDESLDYSAERERDLNKSEEKLRKPFTFSKQEDSEDSILMYQNYLKRRENETKERLLKKEEKKRSKSVSTLKSKEPLKKRRAKSPTPHSSGNSFRMKKKTKKLNTTVPEINSEKEAPKLSTIKGLPKETPRFKKTGGKIGDKKNLKSSGGKTRDKFKTLQSAQASERLAKLEKLYQELSEINKK